MNRGDSDRYMHGSGMYNNPPNAFRRRKFGEPDRRPQRPALLAEPPSGDRYQPYRPPLEVDTGIGRREHMPPNRYDDDDMREGRDAYDYRPSYAPRPSIMNKPQPMYDREIERDAPENRRYEPRLDFKPRDSYDDDYGGYNEREYERDRPVDVDRFRGRGREQRDYRRDTFNYGYGGGSGYNYLQQPHGHPRAEGVGIGAGIGMGRHSETSGASLMGPGGRDNSMMRTSSSLNSSAAITETRNLNIMKPLQKEEERKEAIANVNEDDQRIEPEREQEQQHDELAAIKEEEEAQQEVAKDALYESRAKKMNILGRLERIDLEIANMELALSRNESRIKEAQVAEKKLKDVVGRVKEVVVVDIKSILADNAERARIMQWECFVAGGLQTWLPDDAKKSLQLPLNETNNSILEELGIPSAVMSEDGMYAKYMYHTPSDLGFLAHSQSNVVVNKIREISKEAHSERTAKLKSIVSEYTYRRRQFMYEAMCEGREVGAFDGNRSGMTSPGDSRPAWSMKDDVVGPDGRPGDDIESPGKYTPGQTGPDPNGTIVPMEELDESKLESGHDMTERPQNEDSRADVLDGQMEEDGEDDDDDEQVMAEEFDPRWAVMEEERATKKEYREYILHFGAPVPALVSDDPVTRTVPTYLDNNGFIEDPWQQWNCWKEQHPWTDFEKTVFMEKYALFGKDFRKIKEFLPNKTINHVVTFYYDFKYKYGLKKIARDAGRKKNTIPQVLIDNAMPTSLSASASKAEDDFTYKTTPPAPNGIYRMTPNPKPVPPKAYSFVDTTKTLLIGVGFGTRKSDTRAESSLHLSAIGLDEEQTKKRRRKIA